MPTDSSHPHEPVEDRVWDLIDEADDMPRGPLQVALGEEAVRLADTTGDTHLAFRARQELTGYAYFSGKPELALVTFSWCLSMCDRKPDDFHEAELFWQYKWIVSALPAFPQISRQQIEESLDDFELRYRRNGNTMRPVWLMRQRVAEMMGEPDKQDVFYAKWQDAEYDENDDCEACETDTIADYELDRGRLEQGLKKYAPVLTGKLTCETKPHSSYGRVLQPLLQLGRLREAKQYHDRGREMTLPRPDQFLQSFGRHFNYLGLTGGFAEGVKMFERTVRALVTAGDPLDHFCYLLGLRLLFDRMNRANQAPVKLRMPDGIPLPPRDDQSYPPGELLQWCEGRLDELATAFDTRNGNSRYAGDIEASRALNDLADSLASRMP
ncbi:MAG: hypothetical protein AB7K09_17880 [Planctomycetota bacterium]